MFLGVLLHKQIQVIKMKSIYTYLFRTILCFISLQASAQLSQYDLNAPIGFGRNATGGEGGKNITVTTASELSGALKASGKAIIYIKGEIVVSSMIKVVVKDKTVLGLPGSVLSNPNRTKTGSGILYLSSGSNNVIIRNVTFKSAGAYDVDGNDNLCTDGSTNIWVDHCDFQDGVDGNFDCKSASDNIAVTWCRFRYLIAPEAGGSGGSSDHRFSNLWGSGDDATGDRNHLNTTFMFCRWENCAGRMPRVRFGKVHIINCLFTPKSGAKSVQCGNESSIYLENSLFKGKQDPWYDYTSKSTYKITETGCLFSGCNKPTGTGTGTAFTPDTYYSLNAIDADNVESAVTNESNGAGATLPIIENGGMPTSISKTNSDESILQISNNEVVSTSNATLLIYNLVGELLFMGSDRISISSMLKGIYIVKAITNNGKTETLKFMRQ